MVFSSKPQPLPAQDIPPGVAQCDDKTGLGCARFALAQLKDFDAGFPIDFLPKPSLIRCALLGCHGVHERNFLYDRSRSLKEIIERKINEVTAEKYLLAINKKDHYYCFKIHKFEYSLLDSLKDKTHAIDYILVIPDLFASFVFFEDSPACFMFFRDRNDFERNFMPPEKAMSIFIEHMDKWRITTYEKERDWLEKVRRAMSPPGMDSGNSGR